MLGSSIPHSSAESKTLETKREICLATSKAQSFLSMVSESAKRMLATKLNDLVDLPILGEAHEQMIAEKLVDVCVGPFEKLVPSSETMEEMAQGEEGDEEAMQKSVKDKVLSQLNSMIDIPFANEEQEEKILNMIVDTFLKVCASTNLDR